MIIIIFAKEPFSDKPMANNLTCLIIGYHSILNHLREQYESLGYVIRQCDTVDEVSEIPGEVFILSEASKSPSDADVHVLKELERVATLATPGTKPVVHVMLRDHLTLRVLLSAGFSETIEAALEVYPFTQEDEWAKQVLVRLPGIRQNKWPQLDRQPIGPDSRQRVHLVIIGFDGYAQALAINAALVAHFPNYRPDDDLPIRSRITIIDTDIRKQKDAFISEYRTLFDHSYWRTIDGEKGVEQFHYPMYYGKRQEFTDVEWEFVETNPEGPLIRNRLEEWAADPDRQLTIAISTGDDSTNLRSGMNLPERVRDFRVPVLLRQRDAGLCNSLTHSEAFGDIHPFGMEDVGPDVTLPLYELGKMVHFFYTGSSGDDGLPTLFPREEVKQAWAYAGNFKMRHSSISNVMHMTTKLHSLGHETADLGAFYTLSEQEVETLAVTEHYRWCVERLISGSRPCTDKEKDLIRNNINEIIACRQAGRDLPEDLKKKFKKEKDVHYDLCSYDELGLDASGKDVKLYDYDLTACIPLIINQFRDRSNG